MRSSLTWTDPDGRVREYDLGNAEVVIGREPSCDLIIDSEHVSWSHAAVRCDNGRHLIVDLGSTNGTSVNGTPAVSPILLHTGDRIDIAGAAELSYRSEAGTSLSGRTVPIALAVIATVLLTIAGVFFFGSGEQGEAELARATALAEEGIEAARRGKQMEARDLLRAAAGELYTAGYLDDVPRGELQRAAMQLLQEEIDVSFDLWSFYDNVLHEVRVREPVPREAGGLCRLDAVDSQLLEPCLQQWIEHVLVEIRQDADSIPPDFHRTIGRRLLVEHDFLTSALTRGKTFVPMMRRELEAVRMPPLLHYVALIESGYRNSATSATAAAGVWQFMPNTGRRYGLRVEKSVDERRDPKKATRAAARYLRDLAFEFGGDALLLALAGYNRGENGVRRSLKKLDDPFSERSYWRLVDRDLLPQETKSYVPRFIAAAVAGEGGLPAEQVLREAGY